jgi:hypothetical protein
MKNINLLLLLTFISITAFSQVNSDTLTNNDIIKMSESGLPSSIIISKIQVSIKKFDTSSDALINLNKTKVPVDVISEMMKADKKKLNKKVNSKFYFGILGGYGFPSAKKNANSINTTNTSSTLADKSYSLGKGINTGIYFGTMLSKHLSTELCASYLIGMKSQYDFYNSSGTSGFIKDTTTIKGRMIRLIPALKISIGEKRFQLYMKTGLIIGLGARVEEEFIQITQYNTFDYSINYEYKGGTSFGFNGSLGVNLKLAEKISLFAELSAYYQNWAPKNRTTTKYIINGVDVLPSLTTFDKETEYSSNVTTSYDYYGRPVDPSKPRQEIKVFKPFSSTGFNVGIQINFGK